MDELARGNKLFQADKKRGMRFRFDTKTDICQAVNRVWVSLVRR